MGEVLKIFGICSKELSSFTTVIHLFVVGLQCTRLTLNEEAFVKYSLENLQIFDPHFCFCLEEDIKFVDFLFF